MSKVSSPRRRHVPSRTCVACRTQTSKREFVRIVRSPDGRVEVDETGKRPGRGAYLCRRRSCWEAALGGKKDPLGHALKTDLTASDREALAAFVIGLPSTRDEKEVLQD
ncbi:MAG TPA: YlxR family protein [Dehalococcoidia bacterium]|nr:YlxR family protein [Dehalococcoidia bacterium]